MSGEGSRDEGGATRYVMTCSMNNLFNLVIAAPQRFPCLRREQDRFLPIANISRIMKRNLPANAKIAKDAKDTVQECVSEFISFITSE